MADKAYIVANEKQECEVLNKLYSQGKKWNQLDNYVIPRKQYYVSLPYVIYEYGYSNYLKFGRVPKIKYSTEIVYDGRKEERMSEKYAVSQVFMNELKGWKNTLDSNDDEYKPLVSWVNIKNLPETVYMWLGDDLPDKENNNRLISIIRWVNGEDVFEVEKPKKWVVRSKGTDDDDNYSYVFINLHNFTLSTYHISNATKFDTKEEAESWDNAHQEVIEVEE